MAQILWGNILADKIKAELKLVIDELKNTNKRIPKLVVILVGDDPASQVYVFNKQKACQAVGMLSELVRLPGNTKEEVLLKKIEELNLDETVDGVLVQMPIPKQIDTDRVINMIKIEKDVDGLHPLNIGKLQSRKPCLIPCTPLGIMELIESIDYQIAGKRAVVIGRSNLVGLPIAHLLLQNNATVTICHSYTSDLENICKQADILISAAGKQGLITKKHVKEHALVIDVGTSRGIDGKLHGDVLFDDVQPIVDYITPMPKGVGPMTIAMLLKNTLKAYTQREVQNGI